MGWRTGVWAAVVVAVTFLGCVGTKDARRGESAEVARKVDGKMYVDPRLGFELVRPAADWQLDANTAPTEEGIAVPVVLRHRDTGAQVVVQVAPAVASPSQFAERLSSGLSQHPGFVASDPELVAPDGAVGFRFTMGENVHGRVSVLEGTAGQMFMLMATWPQGAPDEVPSNVDAIFGSIRAVPPT